MKKVISGGKKLRAVKEKIDAKKNYSVLEAVEFLQANSVAKFDQTLDVVIKLGVNVTHSDQVVRGVADMPNGLGKKVRVAALVKDNNVEKAKKAGAVIVGLDDVIEDIQKGKIEFDVCIATPDVMPKIASVAKILGPKGMMPNPKLGTVTMDIEQAIKKVQAGQVEYRTDKGGIVHAGVGKLSFAAKALKENVAALIDAVVKAKPSSSKGVYLKSVFLSSTMGPALEIDVSSLT
jgi:large subunit ribosomal protein L1